MVQQDTRIVSKNNRETDTNNGRKLVISGLLVLQALVAIATLNSFVSGLLDLSQLFFGLNLFAFAGLLYFLKKQKGKNKTNEILKPKLPKSDQIYLK